MGPPPSAASDEHQASPAELPHSCRHYAALALGRADDADDAARALHARLSVLGALLPGTVAPQARCAECGLSGDAGDAKGAAHTLYVCLDTACLYVGCGREDRRHAHEHHRRQRAAGHRSHAVALNLRTFQVWCYGCEAYIAPPLVAAMEPEHEVASRPTSTVGSLGPPSVALSGATPLRSSVVGSVYGVPSALGTVGSVYSAPATGRAGAVGLYNLGNSCYMNAALQALLACPSVVGFFRRCGAFVRRQPHRRLAEALHGVVQQLYDEGAPSAISPSRLVRVVKTINPAFHGYSQQDAMDFVRCVLDRLHDELRRAQSAPREPEPAISKTAVLSELGPRGAAPPKGAAAASVRRDRSPAGGDARPNGDAPHPRGAQTEANGDADSAEEGDKDEACADAQAQATYASVVSDTFGGVLRSEVVCDECGGVSVKDDPFYDVSVPIVAEDERPSGAQERAGFFGSLLSTLGESIGIQSKPVRLETCLRAFCAPERLEGRERYRCERCARLVASQKTLRFLRLPQVLIVQLKRFRHDAYFSSKLGTPVVFPLEGLDVAPLLSAAAPGAAHARYNLAALVSHRGSYAGGHYVAYCRAPGAASFAHAAADACARDAWLEFDDATVTPVAAADVARAQAYALVYHLHDAAAGADRAAVLGQISAALSGGDASVAVSRQWYNRWRTLAHPGPLDNADVVCAHGGVAYEALLCPEDCAPCAEGACATHAAAPAAAELVHPVPRRIYATFARQYGELSGRPAPAVPADAPLAFCARCGAAERALRARRIQEEADVLALDTSAIGAGEHWYLVDSAWLQRWGAFKGASGTGAPPGPITNAALLARGAGLVRGHDYRGLNARVWRYFCARYGGGPAIVRRTINLYAPAVSDGEDE